MTTEASEENTGPDEPEDECPACSTDLEPLSMFQQLDVAGERHPEWQFRCPNTECEVGTVTTDEDVASPDGDLPSVGFSQADLTRTLILTSQCMRYAAPHVAAGQRKYYEALVSEGFTEEQAAELVGEFEVNGTL